MQIAIISDVHLEFGRGNLKVPSADIIILAGDIFNIDVQHIDTTQEQSHVLRAKTFIKECSDNAKNVVMVLGNHEHYGSCITHVAPFIKEFLSEFKNVHVLVNESIVIDGVPIFGATLWTDFRRNDPVISRQVQLTLSDFEQIKNTDNNPVTTTYLYHLNQETRSDIVSFLSRYGHDSIIVTHHAPTWACITPAFSTDVVSYGYANTGLDDIIFDNGPRLWIHGHLHDPLDFKHGNTRILCNPRGYIRHDPFADAVTFKTINWSEKW